VAEETSAPVAQAPETTSNDPAEKSGEAEATAKTTAKPKKKAAPVAEAPDTTSNDPAEKTGEGEATGEAAAKPKKKGKS